jgi:trimethylamine--corrinoid protein Co-methyltransferase
MIRPTIKLLSDTTIERVIAEAYALLRDPGVRVHSDEALSLLGDAGAEVDLATRVVRIPAGLVDRAVETAPSSFHLYSTEGEPVVHYGGDDVHFDPGSSTIYLLDHGAVEARRPITADFVRYIKLAEMLPELDAVSTALVCSDIPPEMGDFYRLYLVLSHAIKPVVTGAFDVDTLHIMKDLLAAVAGSEEALAERPLAVFDVCPSPPLLWSNITCSNLMDLARYSIPAELVSMPLVGATGPATLIGAVVQHAAETLSGIVIHQLVKPGAPIVWGGAPTVFDMRTGAPPTGAIETMMFDLGYVEVGKYLEIPTHTYMAVSDSKLVDAQSGFESGIGAVLAIMGGVNMVSGPGLMDFDSCFSLEKMVVDCDIIAMARRLARGINASEESLGEEVIRRVGHKGKFMADKHTKQWFRQEVTMPSPVTERHYRETWLEQGAKDTAQRAHERAEQLIAAYEPRVPAEVQKALAAMTLRAGRAYGLDELPPLA